MTICRRALRSFLRCLHWGWFSAAISSSGARRLHLTLGFKTWVGYSPFYVADKEGFLAAEGLQVEFQRIEGTAEQRQALIAGRLDALGTTIDDVAVGAEQGVPAKVVLAVDRSNGADGVVVSSDIEDVSELRGRSVAVQPGFVSHFFLLYVLDQHGISPKDIRIQANSSNGAGRGRRRISGRPYRRRGHVGTLAVEGEDSTRR